MNRSPHSDFEDYLDVLGFEPGTYLQRGESLPVFQSEKIQTQQAPSTNTPSAQARVLTLPVLFVGEELTQPSPSRELFLKMVQAMGLQSEQMKVLEAQAETGRLKEEILALNPQNVVIFGNTALPAFFAPKSSVIDLRGHIHSFEGIRVIATHHPALCLINPALKKPVWEDLQIVMQTLGLKS